MNFSIHGKGYILKDLRADIYIVLVYQEHFNSVRDEKLICTQVYTSVTLLLYFSEYTHVTLYAYSNQIVL